MNPKKKHQKMHLMVCLAQILLDTIEELNPTTEVMQKAKNDIKNFCELLESSILDTDTVQKTTYFNDISRKIETVIRKNFNDNY